MDWLELTLTEQEGESDEEFAGSEVVCDFEGRETAKDENGLAEKHGAPPPTITREWRASKMFREGDTFIVNRPQFPLR